MYLKNIAQLFACLVLLAGTVTHTADRQKSDTQTDSELSIRICTLPKDLRKEIISFFPPVRLQRLMHTLKQPLPITHMGIMSGYAGIPHNAVIIASRAVTARPGADYTIKLWDTATGKCIQTVQSTFLYYIGIKQGRLVSVSSQEQVDKLWDARKESTGVPNWALVARSATGTTKVVAEYDHDRWYKINTTAHVLQLSELLEPLYAARVLAWQHAQKEIPNQHNSCACSIC